MGISFYKKELFAWKVSLKFVVYFPIAFALIPPIHKHRLWNTWLQLLEESPSDASLCQVATQLQEEVLSARKLSIVKRTELNRKVDKFLKQAKERAYTLSHAGKLPLNSSFVLEILNYIRENADLGSTMSHQTVNLDPAMKLEGAEQYLSKAQTIFAK